ncbi:MAG: 30S ribosome-binding factor RbfA [Planctomycetaceae bacterium]|jgi:ribosome-binding factor A|nr:30S ribosome-binding factor RbfA [Phycisphaerales bacterium]MCE2653247.1 30S ribosome-binding factor RbfA [Planctomycetaceae bacterium]
MSGQSKGHRPAQIASLLREGMQKVLAKGLGDPRLDGCMVTVTEVDVSPDARNATVWVSVLPDKRGHLAVTALCHAAPHIRRRIGQDLATKVLPQLTFLLDDSLKKQAQVMEALAKVRQEQGAGGGDAGADAGGPSVGGGQGDGRGDGQGPGA